MFSRRPDARFNRGRIATAASPGGGGGGGGGLAPGTALLVWSEGQFNRQHDASVTPTYRTSASAYALGVADTLRLENTGDGNGALLLLEGQRSCINTGSRDVHSWTNSNSATSVADTENGPEGSLTADAVTYPATVLGAKSRTQTGTNVPSSTNLCFQAWAKSGTGGAEKWRFWLQDKSAANPVSSDFTVGATWQPFTWDQDSGAGAGNPVFHLRNASEGVARGAGRIVVFGGVCVEPNRFPSSLILNESGGQNGKRQADVLVYTADQVPLHLCTGKWDDAARVKWANTNLVSGDAFVMYSWGDANNVLRFYHTGTDVRLQAVVGGVVVASSGAVTVARDGYLTFTVDCVTGTLSVNGVAGTPAGAFAFPQGVPLRVGGIVGGASEAFAALRGPQVAA